MTMLSSSLLIIATAILIADYVKPYPHLIRVDDRIERRNFFDDRCRICSDEDCYREPAGGCVNGAYKDKCGYVNCFRGPGDSCNKSGVEKCALDLLCKCKKCKGCRKNRLNVYQCFYGDDQLCLNDMEDKY